MASNSTSFSTAPHASQVKASKLLRQQNYRHSCNPNYRQSCKPESLLRRHSAVGHHLETGAILAESQHEFARRTIALLRNDNLRLTLQIGIVLTVNFLAEDEHHQVGVLL